jgi:hypothetical protein
MMSRPVEFIVPDEYESDKWSNESFYYYDEHPLLFRIRQQIHEPSLQRKFIGNQALTDDNHTINVLQWNILAQGSFVDA